MLHRRGILAGLAYFSPMGRVRSAPRSPGLDALVAGGVVALMRHARAPGTGDPPGFLLGDCATQRNLSDEGRRQAAEIGQRLREAGVLVTDLRASRWCRATETARLVFPQVPVTPEAALDSFFGTRESASRQTEQVRALVAGWSGRQGVLALVTHQVNITALTEVFPAEGEIVVLRPTAAGSEIAGRVRP